MIARRLVVRGRVQGVGYRDWTVDAARGLDLAGWVRNRRDGTVEIHVEGPAAAVASLVEAARVGPSGARVSAVDAEDVAVEGATGFTRAATG